MGVNTLANSEKCRGVCLGKNVEQMTKDTSDIILNRDIEIE